MYLVIADDEMISDGEDAISFVMSCLMLVGMLALIVYTVCIATYEDLCNISILDSLLYM